MTKTLDVKMAGCDLYPSVMASVEFTALYAIVEAPLSPLHVRTSQSCVFLMHVCTRSKEMTFPDRGGVI